MLKRLTFSVLLLTTLTSCIEAVAVTTASSVYLAQKDKTVKDSVKDTKIHASIATRLGPRKERQNFKNVKIDVYEGRVLLTGKVNDKEHLKKLLKTAWSAKGVKEVINEVQVITISKKPNKLYDSLLKANIRRKLLLTKGVKSINISVNVKDKVVYLIGELPNKRQVRKAAKTASKVRGVKKVVSHLRVM